MSPTTNVETNPNEVAINNCSSSSLHCQVHADVCARKRITATHQAMYNNGHSDSASGSETSSSRTGSVSDRESSPSALQSRQIGNEMAEAVRPVDFQGLFETRELLMVQPDYQ